MYPPPYHHIDDIQKIITLIKEYPLAMMVSVIHRMPLITHTPIIYQEENGKLFGHIDKNNPHCVALQNQHEITLVFKGPDCYISPSVYRTSQLPTWNYVIAHITGRVSKIETISQAKQKMVKLTSFLEQPDYKYQLDLEDEKMNHFINYIHAFEIEITNWEGKFKLSQDKSKTDQDLALEELIKNNKNKRDFLKTINS